MTEESLSGIACDNQGVITQYGKGAEKIFGWRPEELIGREKVTIFHPPESVGELVPRLLQTASQNGIFKEEVVLVRKNGSRFRAVLTVRPLELNGNIVGFMGITEPLEREARKPG